MQLSPRLKKIADTLKGYNSVADIGTDHAYLPIYLLKNKMIQKAIAADVNEGPVRIAKSRVAASKLSQAVDIRKGDGMEVLLEGEAEAIVIAGIGGILISEILERSASVAKSAKVLVLQPMRDSDRVRIWLQDNGFEILDEELVKDEGKIYEILWSQYTGTVKKSEDDLLIIGRPVIEKKHPLAKELLDKRIRELENIIAEVSAVESSGGEARLKQCDILLSYYRRIRQCVQ